MIEFVIENSLLLLFGVAAVGYAIGRIKIKGASLGVAAILFVGLAVGALDPNLKLPTVIFELGLVLFVYTVGLASVGLAIATGVGVSGAMVVGVSRMTRGAAQPERSSSVAKRTATLRAGRFAVLAERILIFVCNFLRGLMNIDPRGRRGRVAQERLHS